MDEKIIANEILKWHEIKRFDRNRWNRSPIGLAIKKVVDKHWKGLPRGRRRF